MLKKLKSLLVMFFIGLVLMSWGFGSVFHTTTIRAYTDEEIRIKAGELGMMDVKEVLGE